MSKPFQMDFTMRQQVGVNSGQRTSCRAWVASLSALLLGMLLSACSPESKVARHVERADVFFESGQYDAAEIEYLNAVRLDQANAHAISRLGLICYEQGRAALARLYLLEALRLAPDDLEARVKTGYIDLAMGRQKEAREAALLVLEKQPMNSEAPMLLAETVRTEEDGDDVRKQLDEVAGRGGDRVALLLAKGTICARLGDRGQAESLFQQALGIDPASASAQYAMGDLYWARGDLVEAERSLKKSADLSSWRSPRRLRYVEFMVRKGDVAEGTAALQEITDNAVDYLPAWNRLADIALSETNYTRCESIIKQCLTRDPNNYEAMLLEGRLALARGDRTNAVEVLKRAASIYGRSPAVHYHLALAYVLNDDPVSALESLRQVLALAPDHEQAILLQAQLNLRRGEPSLAISALSPLIRRNATLVPAQLLLASAQIARGNLDDALGLYRHLEEVVPDNPQVPLLRGRLLLQQNRKEEAGRAFERSLSLSPGYLPALEQLVALDLADKRFDQANSRLQAELLKHPDSHELLVLLAQVYLAQKQVDQAEGTLQKAIALDPGYTPAYLVLARLYVDSQRMDQALVRLNELLTRSPDDTVALMLSGMIYSEMEDFTAARSAYERLLAVNPKFSPALNNLANLYSEQFNLQEQAFEMARQARDLRPYDPYPADSLGWILFKRKDYQWALALLQDSAEKLPQQAEVQFHLGMVYYMLGDESRASAALELALASPEAFRGKDEAARALALLAIDGSAMQPEQVALLEQQLIENPQDPVALVRIATRYETQNQPQAAAKVYEQALVVGRKNPYLLTRLAQLYHNELKNDEKALELAREAYGLVPNDPKALQLLGKLAFAAGDHQWALSLLDRSARGGTPDAEQLYELGVVYHAVGRIQDAENTLRRASEAATDPTRKREIQLFLDLIALEMSPAKAIESEAMIQGALAADPANSAALMAAAVADEQYGNYPEARDRYEQLLKRYPKFAPANKRLAALYVQHLKDYQKAYDQAMLAREAYPNDAELTMSLGMIAYERGDYRRSAQLLQISSRDFAQKGDVFFCLGMSFYHLKEAAEAQKALRRAITLDGKAYYVEEAERVLGELGDQ